MTTETATVQALAGEAYAWLETAYRVEGDDDTRYTRCKDGCPQWVTDLVHAAHGDFLPDDWRYDAIRSCLAAIHDDDLGEDDATEWADGNVDVYTGRRFAWLASNLQRQFYCDEAARELGFDSGGSQGVADLVGLGQFAESEEVYWSVLRSLQERRDELEGRDDEEASS